MGERELVDGAPGAPLGASRSAVLEVLRAFGPLGVREAAERTGLHPNTVRLHLDGLVGSGLAERAAERHADGGRPGRPRALYRAVRGDEGEGVRSYRLLAQILTSLVAGTMDDPSGAATEAGRVWGRYLADPPAPFQKVGPGEALARLTAFLNGIGFDSRAGDDLVVRLVHCPFREIAEGDREVVCPLHLGLIQGALAEMRAPLAADRLEPFVEPHLCLAHLSRTEAAPDAPDA
ncbi:helix-turn-helix transcriptional regulator [Actinomadura luteofluorescens]|uniref:helix-turn-helix transcriptional regulator n=1 Tax=Actinomadura luteofluorescens TaxID=46163 RepID=UPI0034861719